jgi:hypothetical protein
MTYALILLSVSRALGDASTAPGKASVFASKASVAASNSGFGSVLTASITKGKKKQVLMVDAYLSDRSNVTGADNCVRVLVNGIDVLEPQTGIGSAQACEKCDTVFDCHIAGQFWLDLDAAETAHPGMFINQPLSLDLQAFSDAGDAVDVSLRAVMVKK